MFGVAFLYMSPGKLPKRAHIQIGQSRSAILLGVFLDHCLWA